MSCILSTLLLLVLSAVASAQVFSGSTSASLFPNSTTSASVGDPYSNTTPTQCEICMGGGDCSKAYNGVAGQFCRSVFDSSRIHPCCCPADDICYAGRNTCTCLPHKSDHPNWLWVGAFVIGGALLCGGILGAIRVFAVMHIFTGMNRMRRRDSRDYPAGVVVAVVQQPVYAPGGYAQQGMYSQPVYAQGGYAQPTGTYM
ncbi:hypothetical protein P3T76_009163 [Phytophthora citrophthora]|uniref:Uncharacterized protein n=1 Tax=Phytophthora citrophthora TaxID=4793 RepID=A0AAD9GH40_9STRA|nr:hypothetical protein P3T76_009163 [Phytophthora citrophthora]